MGMRAPGFDKIVGNDFEQPKAGSEGVRRMDVPDNPLGDAIHIRFSTGML